MIENRGFISAKKKKIAVVVSRTNERITKKLLDGCYEGFIRLGGNKEDFHVYWVPGALEIPVTLQSLARTKKYDGLIALGCVLRGETSHNEYVASEVTRGVAQVQLKESVPIAFGVITADSLEQALERSGGKRGNRGWDALVTLLETINLLEKIEKENS